MWRKTLGAPMLALALVAFIMAAAEADTIDDIKARGKIIVGSKADYKPWGFRDATGAIIGMEADLAKDVADRLGVELELVPVVAANRMQFLEQGKIDLLIATMSDTAKRRKVVGIVHPNYYSSGTNILAHENHGFEEWEDLRGRKVCGIQGAWYNKSVSEKYGAEIVAFKGTPEVYTALKADNCVAFVYDDSSIMSQLADKEKWGGYEMPLATEDDTPWGIAVRLEDKNKAFGGFMSGVIYDWHESGKLIELEKKWGIQPTGFLQKMHEQLKDWMTE